MSEHVARRPSAAGVVVGTAFAMLAMTPSLLPRDWLYQGLVSGISAAVGYALGCLGAWAARPVLRRPRVSAAAARVPARVRRWTLPVVLAASPVALLVMLAVAVRWQHELTSVMGMPPTAASAWLRAAPVLVVVAAVLVAAARGMRALSTLVARALRRRFRLGPRVAAVVASVVVTLVVVVLVQDVLLARALAATDRVFDALNDEDHPGVAQPLDPHRSGSPGSAAGWETLGREGRRFVAGGPTAADLAVTPAGAVAEPVRVYVGLETAPDAEARAAVAVDELERTGGFERSVLVVATTTGSGWVNGSAAEAVELLHGGDTAVVASQYSYLPSWLSFLLDRTRSEREATALFTAVEERLAELPEAERPRVLVLGESQGVFGSEAVFASLADIRARTDGVLWVGPPHASPMWSALVERRDPGTPEAMPVYADGLVVRFASGAADLATPPTPWLEPRVLYLQHRSDPVVWWSPDLLLRRPDWLAEPAGPGAPRPTMTWFPVVTFWQLGFDLLVAKAVPDGHGHNYGAAVVDGWLAVAAPEGWTTADTRALRALVTSSDREPVPAG